LAADEQNFPSLVDDPSISKSVCQARNRFGIQSSNPEDEESESTRFEPQELAALRTEIVGKGLSSNTNAHIDTDAAQHRRECEKKNQRDFRHSYRCFRHRNVQLRELDDLQKKQHEGQVWVQVHFAPWAKIALATRRQARWDKITTVVSEKRSSP